MGIAEIATAEAPLLREQTNEALLVELREARQRRRRIRKILGGAYVIYFTAYMLFIVWYLSHLFVNPTSGVLSMPLLIGSLFLMMGAGYMVNRRFYQGQAKRGNQVIMALAQRGEIRALGPLLDFMDTRMSGQGGWAKNRAVYFDAVVRLLPALTPEAFQELSDAQIHQLTPLLLMPDPALYAAVQDAFIRAGDARALRAIRRMLQVSNLQKVNKWNPMVKPMIRQMKKWNFPVYDEGGQERIEACIASMAGRIEADNRNAQLLRASDGTTDTASELLLRAAGPTETATSPNELLRSTSQVADSFDAETCEQRPQSKQNPVAQRTAGDYTAVMSQEQAQIQNRQ